MPLQWDGQLFHLNYWLTTANAVVNVLQLCVQVLTEADYRHADTALCCHFKIAETDITLPESAFSSKDKHRHDITMLMLMLHCVIKPHSLLHSRLKH